MMQYVAPIADPVSLNELAASVRRSSNFRFAWQFYRFEFLDPSSPNDVRGALAKIIAEPDCHRFLRDTFDNMYEPQFRIADLPSQCQVIDAAEEFEDILASAANDHLGAYSRHLRHATPSESDAVRQLFEIPGEYRAFQLVLDSRDSKGSLDSSFTNWFYGVAWDWCFLLTWAHAKLLWIGCLTDTD